MSVAESVAFPDEGPFWTQDEGQELLRDIESAFPDREVPKPDGLVDLAHSDASAIVAACAGRMWRSLSFEALWRAQDFWGLATEDGYAALLPAYVRAAVVADGQDRLELERLACVALSPKFQGEIRLRSRLGRLTDEQLAVVHRFLTLRYRLRRDPTWRESPDGKFWETYLDSRQNRAPPV